MGSTIYCQFLDFPILFIFKGIAPIVCHNTAFHMHKWSIPFIIKRPYSLEGHWSWPTVKFIFVVLSFFFYFICMYICIWWLFIDTLNRCILRIRLSWWWIENLGQNFLHMFSVNVQLLNVVTVDPLTFEEIMDLYVVGTDFSPIITVNNIMQTNLLAIDPAWYMVHGRLIYLKNAGKP